MVSTGTHGIIYALPFLYPVSNFPRTLYNYKWTRENWNNSISLHLLNLEKSLCNNRIRIRNYANCKRIGIHLWLQSHSPETSECYPDRLTNKSMRQVISQ